MPGGSSRFPTTRHSAILGTRTTEASERRSAWEIVISAYWKPAYKYVRLRWNRTPDAAEDLVQGFFARVIEKEFFDSWDPARGSFRTWFRTCLDGYISNEVQAERREKRGGSKAHLPLDFADAEAELARHSSAVPGPEECFHKEWQRQIFSLAVDDLRSACEEGGKQAHYAIFARYDLSEERTSYDALAAEFGITAVAVTNRLASMRRQLRRAVLERLRTMTVDDREFRREAHALLGGTSGE